MGSLPAEVRKKKVLPFCRLFFQSPDMESQVARCMAQQFPNVLSQVGAFPPGAKGMMILCCNVTDLDLTAGSEKQDVTHQRCHACLSTVNPDSSCNSERTPGSCYDAQKRFCPPGLLKMCPACIVI